MIVFDNVSFKYGESDEDSISNVSFNIKEGEFIVITGKSGSGKSTITRCINGLIPKFFEGEFKGNVHIDNRDLGEMEIHEISMLVGSVFQDPRSQFFAIDTTSELAFTCENYGMEREEIHSRIIESSDLMDIRNLLGRSVFKLSSGEKQKIAISSVNTLRPKILVLDEPSSNLDLVSIEVLKELLLDLKNRGYTIIISEHRLYFLRDLIDRVFYFEDGIFKREFTKKEFLNLSKAGLQEKGLRSMDIFETSIEDDLRFNQDIEILKLEDISYGYSNRKDLLKNINFSCITGDIVALIGNNGVGKTTLGKIISGVHKEKGGRVYLNNIMTNYKSRRRKISFVMQDADYQLFTESIERELLIGNEDIPDIENKIRNALKYMGLYELKDRHPASLSGGQKQRVTIAISMVQNNSLIIMDEPTSGLDRVNMERVKEMVNHLAKQGKAIVMITHDYEFITNTCNKVIHIENGRVVEDYRLGKGMEIRLKNSFERMSKKKIEIEEEC